MTKLEKTAYNAGIQYYYQDSLGWNKPILCTRDILGYEIICKNKKAANTVLTLIGLQLSLKTASEENKPLIKNLISLYASEAKESDYSKVL